MDEPAGRARQCSEGDEDEREPGDERDARGNDLPAPDPDPNPGDRREVARDEGEHAGSHEGKEAREECERDLGFHG